MTTTFTLWLLLAMNSHGRVDLHGQYWSEAACIARKQATENPQSSLAFICHRLDVPQAVKR